MAERYEVRIRGQVDPRWFVGYSSLTLTYTADGNTLLDAIVPDQAGLHGLLALIRDLGQPLILVNRSEGVKGSG
jgi:hypothetical protein